MSIVGYYYLHDNGDLIFKPEYDGVVADIRDSDFARCMWPLNPSDREGAWNICVEGLALGARPQRVADLAAKWGCDDEDADHYAERLNVRIERDGNQWCATGPGFINLQESPAGFGETKLIALAGLAKDLGLRAGKMWRSTFRDILAARAAA